METNRKNLADKSNLVPLQGLGVKSPCGGFRGLPPYFIDTTLRDGEQAPGVVFSTAEKIRIAALLDSIGVPEIEIGTPAMGEKEVEDIKSIISLGFKFKTLAWCRATKNDIRAAAEAGTNGVHLSFPVSVKIL
jgi:homocitrate synthase NifV